MGCCNPVIIRGKIYPSQKAAAQAHGVQPSAVAQAFRRRGDLETLGIQASRKGCPPPHTKETIIFGVRFESQCDAARQLGVPRSSIRRFLRGEGGQKLRQRIYRAMMERGSK